jgi:hypothetical protein
MRASFPVAPFGISLLNTIFLGTLKSAIRPATNCSGRCLAPLVSPGV